MFFLFDIIYQHAKVVLVVVALILFMAFGECISECVAEYGGDY